MKIKIKLDKIEDKLLLLEYCSRLGYEGTISGNRMSVSEELPQLVIDNLTNITSDKLKSISEVIEILAERELEKALEKEQEKIKLEQVIANESVSQAVRDAAQIKLDELNVGGE